MFLTSCCRSDWCRNGWGHALCRSCGQVANLIEATPRLDVIAWLFPAQPGPRPIGEPVFVRYGRKIELLESHEIRGRPDAWSWTGA